MSEKVIHKTAADLIHEYWKKQARIQIEEMEKQEKISLVTPKMKVRMRRKAWRPLNLGVKIYTNIRARRLK